jgi:HEPN domain-containing protein
MAEEKPDFEEIKNYWLTEAEEALRVAGHLLEKGDYSYSLFFGHLAIEKILKSLYVIERKEHAPPLHNLVRLAKEAGLSPDEKRIDTLIRITTYNIEARYPDIKSAFRKKCTSDFTINEMKIIKEIFQWIKCQLR